MQLQVSVHVYQREKIGLAIKADYSFLDLVFISQRSHVNRPFSFHTCINVF